MTSLCVQKQSANRLAGPNLVLGESLAHLLQVLQVALGFEDDQTVGSISREVRAPELF